MKKLSVILLTAVAVVSSGFSAFAAGGGPERKVIVYYFHGTFRCYTCTAMEEYSKAAIETSFKDALASGRLEFKSVNVEDRGNEHFVEDYQIYTKTLILSLVKGGKEIKSKNLDKIWEYARNKQRFSDYVVEEVGSLLKEAQ